MRDMKARLSPLGWAGIAAALALSSPLRGQEQPPAPPPRRRPRRRFRRICRTRARPRRSTSRVDNAARMTVPVSIAGHGPYRIRRRHRLRADRRLARAGQHPRARPGADRDRAQHDRGQPDPDRARPGPDGRPADDGARSRRRRWRAINLGAAGMLGVDTLQTPARDLRFPAPRDDGDAVAPHRSALARRTRSWSPRAAASAG